MKTVISSDKWIHKWRCAFLVEWIVGENRRKDQPWFAAHDCTDVWNHGSMNYTERHTGTGKHCKKRPKTVVLAIMVLLKHEKPLTSLLLYSTWKWTYPIKPFYSELLILFKLLSILGVFDHLLETVTLLSNNCYCQPLLKHFLPQIQCNVQVIRSSLACSGKALATRSRLIGQQWKRGEVQLN